MPATRALQLCDSLWPERCLCLHCLAQLAPLWLIHCLPADRQRTPRLVLQDLIKQCAFFSVLSCALIVEELIRH